MKKYLPLILVETYLLITLLLFYVGPIDFEIHNHLIFAVLLFLYHGAFILGYVISIKTKPKTKFVVQRRLSTKFFYISFCLGLVGVFGSYKNLMLSSSFIPYDFFDNLIRGLSEPGVVYAERMMNAASGVTPESRLFNVASIFFLSFKLLFIFQAVYFWGQLGRLKKLLFVVYSLLFISSGIASGTNSVLFIFFIFLIFSTLVVLYVHDYAHLRRVLIICSIAFLLPVASFGYIMSQRGGGFEYFSGTSPLGDINVSVISPDLDNASLVDFFYYSFVWLDYYLVQGYYGFSLILNLDHNWTFGFGNSAFLQRQLLLLTGIDVSELTFQHRISDMWDESAQWHSFYGQFANDFGLIGLTVFMFFLGYYFAKTWISVIYKNSFYGAALMPVFALMFIFIPANNQVFAYIDTLSYFIFVSVIFALEDTKIKL